MSGAADQRVIGVTMGDPAGIGPEIVLKALADPELAAKCMVIGDAEHLRAVADRLSIRTKITDAASDEPGIRVLDLSNVPADAPSGIDSAVTGGAAAEHVIAAVDLWRQGKIRAVATAP